MTSQDFCYWLQGWVEIKNDQVPPTAEQWQMIKAHLSLAFVHVTPNPSKTEYVPQPSGYPMPPLPWNGNFALHSC